MRQDNTHRFQETSITKEDPTTTTTTSTSNQSSSSSSSSSVTSPTPPPHHQHHQHYRSPSPILRPTLQTRNTSTTHITLKDTKNYNTIAFQRYSDFCDDCGVDVFRFCHEHWCKNFQ